MYPQLVRGEASRLGDEMDHARHAALGDDEDRTGAIVRRTGSEVAARAADQGSRLILAQGRIVDAVADGVVLVGTADELAGQLLLGVAEFWVAVEELAGVGWLVVTPAPGGRLRVRCERRSANQPAPGVIERRRPRYWQGGGHAEVGVSTLADADRSR